MILLISLIDVCKNKFTKYISVDYCLGIIKIPSIKNLINLTNDSVHCVDYRHLDASALSTMYKEYLHNKRDFSDCFLLLYSVLISVIVFLILLATGLHVMYETKPNMKKNDLTSAPATETLLSRTIITTDNPSSSDHRTDECNQSTSPDEVAPLVTTPDGRLDSGTTPFDNMGYYLSFHFFFL